MVRPHVAVVTTIAPAHMEYFGSEEAIADAKGEIFEGLEPGGTAIIPFDSPHYARLRAKAEKHAAHVVRFGQIGRAHVCTPVPNAHLVCRLLLANNTYARTQSIPTQ